MDAAVAGSAASSAAPASVAGESMVCKTTDVAFLELPSLHRASDLEVVLAELAMKMPALNLHADCAMAVA